MEFIIISHLFAIPSWYCNLCPVVQNSFAIAYETEMQKYLNFSCLILAQHLKLNLYSFWVFFLLNYNFVAISGDSKALHLF